MNSEKKTSEIENIDLAYSYTKDFFEDRRKEIDSINTRLTTLLVFGGFLLRFGVDLPHSSLEYRLTKVTVLVFSFFSIVNLLYGLTSSCTTRVVNPSYLMEDDCFQQSNTEVKAMIVNTHKEGIYNIELLVKKKQEILQSVKGFLLTGTFFYLLNVFWLIYVER